MWFLCPNTFCRLRIWILPNLRLLVLQILNSNEISLGSSFALVCLLCVQFTVRSCPKKNIKYLILTFINEHQNVKLLLLSTNSNQHQHFPIYLLEGSWLFRAYKIEELKIPTRKLPQFNCVYRRQSDESILGGFVYTKKKIGRGYNFFRNTTWFLQQIFLKTLFPETVSSIFNHIKLTIIEQ